MKVVPLLFFLLATSIQGGFAALNNDNPLTNPDLPPTVRANLESRILQWLCPRIKMTASNYIRSRLYPLSGRLTGSLSSIPASRTWGLFEFIYFGPPLSLYLEPFLFERPKLQSWLEQLTPAQKQRLDDALIVSIAAYIKTHPNVFMVCCVFAQHSKVTWGDPFVCVFSIYPDLNDSFYVQLLPPLYPGDPWFLTECPLNSWVEDGPGFICQSKTAASGVVPRYQSDISSVTYFHGGKQIVLTPKNPVFWSN